MGFGWTIDDVTEPLGENTKSPLYAYARQIEAALAASQRPPTVVSSMGSDIFNDVVAAIDPTSTIPAVTNSTGGGKYQPPKAPAPAAEISYNAHGPAISSDLNAEVPMWKNPLVIGGAIVIAYIVLKRI